ncbi:MAG TPA: DegT/DnrJ/EryC1/StrS family aminotransferase [Gammaproteobacteria bacterium]
MPGPDTIPLLDLAPLHAALRPEIDAAIARVVDSDRFVFGKALANFESQAAKFLRARHAIGVANGTDALLLALRAAGIGRGDEVVTSAFTFFATVEAIIHAGARPVFADIDPASMTLDPHDVETRITPKTRALLPVHVFGHVANIDALLGIADAHNLIVIEDAAQAFGASLNGKMAGAFGLAGCFSFHPSKPLGAFGDGGMIITDDDELATQISRLRDHGSIGRHQHATIGYNSRLDDIQAAVLGMKLEHLDSHLSERRKLATSYNALLAGLPMSLPIVTDEMRHCYAQYTVRTSKRDALRNALDASGIGNAIHYPLPVYRQPALAGHIDSQIRLPVTEETCASCLSLPFYKGLTEAQQQRVADVVRDVVK